MTTVRIDRVNRRAAKDSVRPSLSSLETSSLLVSSFSFVSRESSPLQPFEISSSKDGDCTLQIRLLLAMSFHKSANLSTLSSIVSMDLTGDTAQQKAWAHICYRVDL